MIKKLVFYNFFVKNNFLSISSNFDAKKFFWQIFSLFAIFFQFFFFFSKFLMKKTFFSVKKRFFDQNFVFLSKSCRWSPFAVNNWDPFLDTFLDHFWSKNRSKNRLILAPGSDFGPGGSKMRGHFFQLFACFS